MTRIKICGITIQEEIDEINRCSPDYIGFVFAHSRRRVTHEQARGLKKQLATSIKAVGVFVNEPVAAIISLANEGIIDCIQLHGDEDEACIHLLKQKTACPVIKAVRVREAEQLLLAQRLPCDILLLDSYQENEYGGSGKSFDHTLIPPMHKPFFVAGGLHAGNIEQCIMQYNPYGVDISSGVETNGKKDESKIKEIMDIVHRLNDGKGAIA